MQVQRLIVGNSPPPFPIYPDPAGELLRAHAETSDRDPAVAHILAVLSGYAYGDTATVATMASRLGMAGSACMRIAEAVDAMYIFSTAYLLQSRCGRVAILCYRGTELANLANWLGNADVGSHTVDVGGARLSVHAGFQRNLRATRWPILESLHAAARGESIVSEGREVDHPLEARYVTGHSLGEHAPGSGRAGDRPLARPRLGSPRSGGRRLWPATRRPAGFGVRRVRAFRLNHHGPLADARTWQLDPRD
jgi:hypothetical protein